MACEKNLNLLEATELQLGLPGMEELEKAPVKSNKRALPRSLSGVTTDGKHGQESVPPIKTQVVGWPPIRTYRKNCLQANKSYPEIAGSFVKVSMDGAPYLRKIDLKAYQGYQELREALEDMFKFTSVDERSSCNGSEGVLTYEDKDGDWMLVGDVPWNMFIYSCTKLRIMKGAEAGGMIRAG